MRDFCVPTNYYHADFATRGVDVACNVPNRFGGRPMFRQRYRHQKPSRLRAGSGKVISVYLHEVVTDILRRESNWVGLEDEQLLANSNDRAIQTQPGPMITRESLGASLPRSSASSSAGSLPTGSVDPLMARFNSTSGSRSTNKHVGEKFSSHNPTVKKSSGIINTTT